jgi:hypothetical protein
LRQLDICQKILILGLGHHLEAEILGFASQLIGFLFEPLRNLAFQLVEVDDLLLQSGDLGAHFGVDIVRFGAGAIAECAEQLLLHL